MVKVNCLLLCKKKGDINLCLEGGACYLSLRRAHLFWKKKKMVELEPNVFLADNT